MIRAQAIDPILTTLPSATCRHLFRHLLDKVLIVDETRYLESFSSRDLSYLRISSRLACVLWPEETRYYAEVCLRNNQKVDDATDMLMVLSVRFAAI